MTKKYQPACPCCGPCKIDSLAAETSVSSDVIRSAEHPQSPYPTWLQVEIKAAVGDVLKLFLVWDESTPGDGLYVEFTPQDGTTNGSLKLYRKDGTQLGTTLQLLCAEPDIFHRITACYDPDTDEFTACFDARDSEATTAVTTEGETGVNEVQSLTVYGPSTFKITFGGETTAEIASDASAAEIQAALELLSTIGTGNVSVTGTGPFAIEFTGMLAETDVALMPAASVREWAVRGQCVSAEVPSDFEAGRKAGYGGVGSVRKYKYDRLWYCGDPPYTEDCHVLGDDWDYYYNLPPRTICHRCGSPSCIVVSETFSGITGTVGSPGDMPCGWDASATNWGVVDGAATGDGWLCHEYDTTIGDSTYTVTAAFDLGHLEALGDSVSIALRHGSETVTMTFTRVAGVNPGDPDRYSRTTNIPGDSLTYFASLGLAGIQICPDLVCFPQYNVGQAASYLYFKRTITPGPVCVSITQPTMSGHEDASLTSLSIVKAYSNEDPQCPQCGCIISCLSCENPVNVYVNLGAAFLSAQRTCSGCNDVQGVIGAQYYGYIGNSYCAWSFAVTYCTCTHPSCAHKVPPHNKTTLSFWITLSVAFDPVQGAGFVWQLGASWFRVADPTDKCGCGGGNVGYISGWQPNCILPQSLEMNRVDNDPTYEFCGQTGAIFPNPADSLNGEGCECLGEWPLKIYLGTNP